MRPIKFRGKIKNNSKWVYGNLIKVDDYCCILELDCENYGCTYLNSDDGCVDGRAVPVIPKTIGQCTGFKDGKGVEIYEGDLVALDADCVGEVYWNECMGRYDVFWKTGVDCIKHLHQIDWLNYNNARFFTVVGSIHDEVKSND